MAEFNKLYSAKTNSLKFKNKGVMEKLVGRIQEKKIKDDALKFTGAELIAIYGRRRLGQTFLIRSVYEKYIKFGSTGVHNTTMQEQFGRRKYRIPTSQIVKMALELSDIQKIYYHECDPEADSEQRARDFWLFSYFGNGMDAKDIAFLTFMMTI